MLATNTSSDLDHRDRGAARTRPDKVIGMHFMNPVPVMQLVEVIRGLATSDETHAARAWSSRSARQDAGRGERLSRASSPTAC